MRKLLTNPAMNPVGKPVILFAPNYGPHATKNVSALGVLVVRSIEELLEVLVQI